MTGIYPCRLAPIVIIRDSREPPRRASSASESGDSGPGSESTSYSESGSDGHLSWQQGWHLSKSYMSVLVVYACI